MSKHYEILVVGGGNAGISSAAQLLRKKPGLKIGIIEPSEKHYYQPAWTLVGGGAYKMEATIRDQKNCMPKGADWIKDAAESFDADNNVVKCTSGDEYSYDVLILTPGIQLDWHKIKGAKESLGKNGVTTNYMPQYAPYTWETIRNFKRGNAIFTNPNTPIKCGGAPQKIMYLASDYFRKNGILSRTNVHFYSGGGVIFGVEKYAKSLLEVVNRYGIKLHYKHNLVEIKGDEKIAIFETTDEHGKSFLVEQPFDMIHVTPPQSAPDFIKRSPFAIPDTAWPADTPKIPGQFSYGYLGWIDVDKYTLQHNRYPNVFACGDAANTPNAKTGAAIRKQVPVMVGNILTYMSKKSPVHKYNGYGSCPLVTGYGKLILAEFDYNNQPIETFPFDQSKERWSMWMLKKHILPWLYWNKILKGTA
ncbi:FAD-dependent pyridine nucleotide-disulfide oxidoreductase [Schleiferia thermophila str. Yellowstone]|jgi:sulfide:quinone oxidoreductase|uniref:NAD(P)/FAD-dependent oxidoreductase n=1 Tax=Schleiferia thermophila TaxID=884107 RepID=UPI0004E76D44|nr:FAD/NAD(P)-binding oxidoreductase [Schleiferia thermophila]KFD39010.1 FAD-dependent pyridine nucleotide-disulfide oxidoreductase [Schleiferia thermophila str. Yellowstone]PMB37350.1 NAD(P)/FAD-dependent oxidoreductase [Fischerella thermalis CCMEE 5319]